MPGWLSWLSVWLQLRSWSLGSWVQAPRWSLCWQLRTWSLLWILCFPLSLPNSWTVRSWPDLRPRVGCLTEPPRRPKESYFLNLFLSIWSGGGKGNQGQKVCIIYFFSFPIPSSFSFFFVFLFTQGRNLSSLLIRIHWAHALSLSLKNE